MITQNCSNLLTKPQALINISELSLSILEYLYIETQLQQLHNKINKGSSHWRSPYLWLSSEHLLTLSPNPYA